MISYVLPTRDRPAVLRRTLDRLVALGPHDAEVVVVDNASAEPVRAETRLASGVPVRVVRLERNLAAAARNMGVKACDCASAWVVMLDDDSYPLDLGFMDVLRHAPADLGALAAEVWLPDTGGVAAHERGGLPEVFIGCGAAVRRGLFAELGGYDHAFDYYAEEYDLCAKVIRAGMRVATDRRFQVMHHKELQGRRFGRIVRNLTRNNAWVMQRYAPADERGTLVRGEVARYGRIARKERATGGWVRGVADLAWTLWRQPRRELTREQWERFTGLAAARDGIGAALREGRFATAAVIAPGKNEQVIRAALAEHGARVVEDDRAAEALVIGTMSPGPMLDALAATAGDGRRIIAPWRLAGERASTVIQAA